MKKLFLEIAVALDPAQITALKGPDCEVVVLPFTGTAAGEDFTGEVCPGAADVQTVNAAGVRHMCAKYMLRGTDSAGQACHIFVENNGWFEPTDSPKPGFATVPTLWTDSKLLASRLHRRSFVGEGLPREDGVTIRLYELTEETSEQ